MFGGPCHISDFKQCSGDLIFLREQLVYLVFDKINFTNIVNIEISEFEFLLQNHTVPL